MAKKRKDKDIPPPHQVNIWSAILCLKDGKFYLFSDFEEIFGIGASAAKGLKSLIMKAFSKNELSSNLYYRDDTDYIQVDQESFRGLFDIQIVEESQGWDSYLARSETNCLLMPLIHNLAIHIIDLIAILKESNLTAEAEFFQKDKFFCSTCSQREIGKIMTSKRNKEIINKFEAIRKRVPTESDTEIVKLIKKDSKNNKG
jgi:hypothetical protein